MKIPIFLLSSFFDVAQIRNLEESHRLLDIQIDRLIPYVSQQTEEFNVHNMVQAMRVLQNRIEDKLVNFYQSLQERDRMKVVFTLPQLRDYSFVEAVNRSVHHLGDSSVSQSISHSIESINESTSKSVSSDSSLVQNSSNNFSHIRTSYPKKEGTYIPKFKPHIDKDVLRDKEPVLTNLLGGNNRTRTDNKDGIG